MPGQNDVGDAVAIEIRNGGRGEGRRRDLDAFGEGAAKRDEAHLAQ